MENHFYKNLKFLRKNAGISQQKIADKIGVDRSTIGYWETGKSEASMLNALKIADFFKIDIKDMLLKDLSIDNKNEKIKEIERSEEEKQEALRQVLKDKGILDENDEMSEEDFNRLLDFAKANKDFILKDK